MIRFLETGYPVSRPWRPSAEMWGRRGILTLAVLSLFHAVPAAGNDAKPRLSVIPGVPARNAQPKPATVPPGALWWLYPVTITETSGHSAVRLTHWRKCYEGGQPFRRLCDPVRTSIARLFGTDIIPAGGTLTLNRPAWLWSAPTGETIAAETTYYGIDAQSRAVEASYRISVRAVK